MKEVINEIQTQTDMIDKLIMSLIRQQNRLDRIIKGIDKMIK
ncbi:hypothetical protein ACFL1H_07410 [Nanoarchaeota archaeon]